MGKSLSSLVAPEALGLAMAAGLASAGAKVVLVNRNAEQGKEAAESIREEYGTDAIYFSANVTQESQTEAMAKATIEAFRQIDILINSAGINIRGPIDELSPDDFDQVMDINGNGTWLCYKAVTPHMKKQQQVKSSISPVPWGW